MEISKPIDDLDPRDRAAVERLFGRPLGESVDGVVVLRTSRPDREPTTLADKIPPWFDVLEGLSDEDLAEVNSIIALPTSFGLS